MIRSLPFLVCLALTLVAPACSDSSTPQTADAAIDSAAPDGPVTNQEAGVDSQPDQPGPVDKDGDGHTSDVDCDDDDAKVHPGADETCNGKDDDCDGDTDEDGATDAKDWYPDVDGDGYGDTAGLRQACGVPAGYVLVDGDCNDNDKAINPGASELCFGAGNQIDDDCDGNVDEADSADALVFYRDSDGDGYGDPADTSKGCVAPTGYVANADDCDDKDKAIKPGAVDLPDKNGADTNCDQVDGDLAHAIFVSPGGNATADGRGKIVNGTLVVAAVQTLAKAITLADACQPNKCYVLISASTYDQLATTLQLADGVSLHGGYDGAWGRTLARDKVIIKGSASPTLRATGLTVATRVDRLTVIGPDFSTSPTPGLESIAVLVDATPGPGILTFEDVQVTAGSGSAGTPGVDGTAGTAIACGCKGGTGGVSEECWEDKPTEKGAAGACGSGAAGGNTGYDTCQNLCGLGPPSDSNGKYHAGGGSGGTLGKNGANGASGGSAGSPPNGAFAGTDWQPGLSGDGKAGEDGGGGGGGGAGGHYRWWCTIPPLTSTAELSGGTGGEGGDGGCGAKGGAAGQPGGASFGLVVIDSAVTLDTFAIALGAGGAGGAGGNGGRGGPSSMGKAGGPLKTHTTNWFAKAVLMKSGAGGKGGPGGHGGGGAGGAGGNGGPSIGLAVSGTHPIVGTPTFDQTAAVAGQGGAGGLGGRDGDNSAAAPAGAQGISGQLADFLQF
jgi:hypothetical protein